MANVVVVGYTEFAPASVTGTFSVTLPVLQAGDAVIIQYVGAKSTASSGNSKVEATDAVQYPAGGVSYKGVGNRFAGTILSYPITAPEPASVSLRLHDWTSGVDKTGVVTCRVWAFRNAEPNGWGAIYSDLGIPGLFTGYDGESGSWTSRTADVSNAAGGGFFWSGTDSENGATDYVGRKVNRVFISEGPLLVLTEAVIDHAAVTTHTPLLAASVNSGATLLRELRSQYNTGADHLTLYSGAWEVVYGDPEPTVSATRDGDSHAYARAFESWAYAWLLVRARNDSTTFDLLDFDTGTVTNMTWGHLLGTGGAVVSRSVDWGDGIVDTQLDDNSPFSHQYAVSGDYDIVSTIIDEAGSAWTTLLVGAHFEVPLAPEPTPPGLDLRLVRLTDDDLPHQLHTGMLGDG